MQKEIVECIERQYGLHEVSINTLPGYRDSNFRVSSAQGSYFLRRYNSEQAKNAQFHAALYKELQQQNYPVAELIKTQDGESLISWDKDFFILQEFIQLPLLADIGLTAPRLFAAGARLAELHSIRLESLAACPYLDCPWNMENFAELLSSYQLKRAEFTDEAKKELDRLNSDWKERSIDFNNISPSFIHNDFHQHNLMFHGEDCARVIDFAEAMPGARIVDIAVALQYLAFDKLPTAEASRSFLEGYRNSLEIDRPELELLPLLVQARAAMSYYLNFAELGKERRQALKVMQKRELSKEFAL